MVVLHTAKSCPPPLPPNAHAPVADARPRPLQAHPFTLSPCESSYLDVIDMAALVVAATAMVFVSVFLSKLRLPLSPRCTLSCAKQGAPCKMCMRKYVHE